MQEPIAPTTFWVGVIKAPVFALLIGFVGTVRGMQVRESSRELGRLTTVAVVQSIFLVILADATVRGAVPASRHMSDAVIEVRGIVNRFGAQVVHDRLDMEVHGGRGLRHRRRLGQRQIGAAQDHPRPAAARAGTVKLYGRDITTLSESELREVKRHYGVTFQHGALFTSLNVTQNVQLPMTEFFDLEDEALDALARLKLHMVGLRRRPARSIRHSFRAV